MANDRSWWQFVVFWAALTFPGCSDDKDNTSAGVNEAGGATPPAGVALWVNTEKFGVLPEDVESTITIPLEQALLKSPQVSLESSLSRNGHSMIVLRVAGMQNRDRAKNAVNDLLAPAWKILPDQVELELRSYVPVSLPDVWVVIQSEQADLAQLSHAASSLRVRMSQTSGVHYLILRGEVPRQTEIRLDPQQLASRGISLEQCMTALNHGSLDANVPLEEWGELVVTAAKGEVVRLRDLGTVQRPTAPLESWGWFDGRPAVAMGIGVDKDIASEVLPQLKQALSELRQSLPEGTMVATWPEDIAAPCFLVELHAPPGTTLQSLRKLAAPVEQALSAAAKGGVLTLRNQDRPHVVQLWAQSRGNSAKLAAAARAAAPAGARLRMTELPGGLATRIPAWQVELALVGPDRAQLEVWAADLSGKLSQAGYQDVLLDGNEREPQIEMNLDRERMTALGLNEDTVRQWQMAANPGGVVLNSKLGPKVIRVLVGNGANELAELSIATGNQLVRLDSIAQLTISAPKFTRRLRFGGQPAIRVTAALAAGADNSPAGLAAANEQARQIAERVKQVWALPAGYRAVRP